MTKRSIDVVLDNRVAVFPDAGEMHSDGSFDVLRSYFRYRNPGCYFSMSYRCGAWDGFVNLLKRGRVPAGVFLHQLEKIEKGMDVRFKIQDKRKAPVFRSSFPASVVEHIRPYQESCVKAMVVASNCGGIVRNATGTGKTFLTGAYFSLLRGSACFIVDELTLLEQAVRELKSVLGEPVGMIGDQEFRPERITVATIQTLHRHRRDAKFMRWSRQLDVMVVDELHLALNRRNVDVINEIRPLAVFGLTATLEMAKPEVGLRATALTGPPIFEYDLKTGVEQGFLSRGVVCRVRVEAAGEFASYQEEYRGLISHNRKRNDCIEALCREGLRRGKRVIVLVERLAHLRLLARRLTDTSHEVLCGAVPKMERFRAKTSMDAGKTRLLLATRVFSKGVDIRTVDVIIDATAGKSHNSAIQRYGRGVRRARGKSGLLYFDIADVAPTDGKKSYLATNRFAACARSRWKALQGLGVIGIKAVWGKHSPGWMYQVLEKKLSAANNRISK